MRASGQPLFDQPRQFQAGAELPGHGGEAYQVGTDLAQGPLQIAAHVAALADQIDEIDVMTRIDVGAQAGDAQIGHMEGRLVHDDRSHIRHGDQYYFHRAPFGFKADC